jgi:formylglycine-generating enzyme required for sulfatase activity
VNKQLWLRLAVLFVLVAICGLGACFAPSYEGTVASPGGQAAETPIAPPAGQTGETPAAVSAAQASPTPTIMMEVPPTDTPAPPPSPPPTLTTAPTVANEPPTAANEPPKDEMISIPAGDFTMGTDTGDPDQAPAHTVSVAAFKMDKTEVTNAAFAAFAKATGYKTTAEEGGGGSWRDYAEGRDDHPVVKVSWADATAFCTWAGKRLPTEAEWEYAARGTDGRIYPWGNEWNPDACNGRERGIRTTTAVGSFPAGASPFGILDMAGNVREWTADWYDKYPGSSFSSAYFKKFRVHRGGGWYDPPEGLRTTVRNAGPPETANDDLGFRCAGDAQP